MTDSELYVNSDDYKEDFVFLNTRDIGLDIIVKTPHTEFQKLIEDCEKDTTQKAAAILFKQIWASIKMVTKDGTDKIFNVEPEWSNLMDDIALFYACRWVLFKKPVPITQMNLAKIE